MTVRTRTAVALTDTARERLAQMAELAGLSQNATLESIILAITDDELRALTGRGIELVRAEKKVRLAEKRVLREKIAALTPAEQKRLFKLAKDE
jgi:chromosome segregation and condensation protein ScpB